MVCAMYVYHVVVLVVTHHSWFYWVHFFRSLTRSDHLWSFPSRFSIVSGTKLSRFLIVPEQPVSIQNRSGSIVRKPGVAGEMSSVSQSDVLFTTDGFQASW